MQKGLPDVCPAAPLGNCCALLRVRLSIFLGVVDRFGLVLALLAGLVSLVLERGGLVLEALGRVAGGVVGLAADVLGLIFEHRGLVIGLRLDVVAGGAAAAAASCERREAGKSDRFDDKLHMLNPLNGDAEQSLFAAEVP